MTAQLEIEQTLTALIAALRARGQAVDAPTVRQLRDFGIACWDIGMQVAHSRSTIPSPIRGDDSRYSIHFDDNNDTNDPEKQR